MTNYSYTTKNQSTYSDTLKTRVDNFLVTEDSFNLLLETGDKFLIENSNSMWVDTNKNSTSYTYSTKN